MMNKELILCYTELKWTGMFFFVAVLIIRLRLIEHSTERAKGAECAECAERAKGASAQSAQSAQRAQRTGLLHIYIFGTSEFCILT